MQFTQAVKSIEVKAVLSYGHTVNELSFTDCSWKFSPIAWE